MPHVSLRFSNPKEGRYGNVRRIENRVKYTSYFYDGMWSIVKINITLSVINFLKEIVCPKLSVLNIQGLCFMNDLKENGLLWVHIMGMV